MNADEKYFLIFKNNETHILSNRTPFRWKELLLFSPISCLVMFLIFHWILAIYLYLLTTVFYTLYRFASWIYYTEISINKQNGKLIKVKRIFNKNHTSELITKEFNISNLEYIEIERSGKKKFLMNYKTHKNNELLIIKNNEDKNRIKEYIEKI